MSISNVSINSIINYYVKRINVGKLTIDSVPDKFKPEVQARLDK